MTTPPRRRRDRNARRSDALLGYLIPVFFVLLAGHQQVTKGHVDQEVMGCLLIFGLGALGYRVDVLFEKWLEYRGGARGEGELPPGPDDESQ